jgi:DNA-binding GntR family transcriptional regulator
MQVPDKTDAYAAYRRVRDLILRTELPPGAALNEADLMRRIGVGRTPLRDALHLLQHEGLVEILPRKGTFVSQVTVGDLQQIFEVRNGIEDIVARAAAARADSKDVRAIRTLAQRASAVNQPESDVSIDQEFHARLLEIAGNRYLLEMYQRLADASLRLLYLTRCGMEPPEDQARTIRRAADALEDRDAGALGKVLRDHVRAFRDRVSGSLFEDTPVAMRLAESATRR